jgi:fumarylacetoacetate (FAA) hydrolase
MRVASLRDGRDGLVVVVSEDLGRWAPAPDGLRTLQHALDEWDAWEQRLEQACADLDAGRAREAFDLDPRALTAPLPRAFQWSESSSFLAHMERCRRARGAALPKGHGVEMVVYQAGSDCFLGPREDVPLADLSWGLDVEPTIAVITDDVPAGTSAADVPAHVKLVLLANDWTLRNLLPVEFEKSAGFYQCKPYRTFSPIAVSPGALGPAWDGVQLHAEVRIEINGTLIGRPDAGADMTFDFGRIVEHMSVTREIGGGSIIGSGTVSNRDPAVGIGCLAELRAHQITQGKAGLADYLAPGDTVAIDAVDAAGRSLFGAMRQAVVPR